MGVNDGTTCGMFKCMGTHIQDALKLGFPSYGKVCVSNAVCVGGGGGGRGGGGGYLLGCQIINDN